MLLATQTGRITGAVSPQVLEESRRNLEEKLPQSAPRLSEVLARTNFDATPQPTAAEALSVLHLVNDRDDSPILAAAQAAQAAYLVTFNLRHYHVGAIAAELGIKVLVPGDLLKELRQNGILPA